MLHKMTVVLSFADRRELAKSAFVQKTLGQLRMLLLEVLPVCVALDRRVIARLALVVMNHRML